MMVKKPKATQRSALMDGLNWVSTLKSEFCILDGQYIRASNGLITMGYPCEEYFGQAPSLAHLTAAIKVSGEQYQIVEEAFKLTITSFNFKAVIKSIDVTTLPEMTMAPSIAKASGEFIRAGGIAGKFSSEGASRLLEASLYCKSGSILGTDGKCLIEAWHGIDMPEIILPCATMNMLSKIRAELIGFGIGCNQAGINSITFWFNNDAYLTSQLYVGETWPTNRVTELLAFDPSECKAFPSTFFIALEEIKPFVIDKGTIPAVVLLRDRCKSHDDPGVGAEIQWGHDMDIEKFRCNIHSLLGLSGHVHRFVVDKDKILLIGKNTRAVVMGVK